MNRRAIAFSGGEVIFIESFRIVESARFDCLRQAAMNLVLRLREQWLTAASDGRPRHQPAQGQLIPNTTNG